MTNVQRRSDPTNRAGIVRYDGKAFSIVDVYIAGMRGGNQRGFMHYQVRIAIYGYVVNTTYLYSIPSGTTLPVRYGRH